MKKNPITLLRLCRKIQYELMPNKNQKEIKKYFREGGDFSQRFNYLLNEKSIVFDLGGFEGQWSSDLYARFPCNIYIFEPVFSYFKLIQNRFKYNKQVKVFAFGLGAYARKENIFINGDASSIINNYLIHPSSKSFNEISIESIESFTKNNIIKKIDLLKINIEGGEYEVLDFLVKSDLIKSINNIQVQFHNINQHAYQQMYDLRKQICKTHDLVRNYDMVWDFYKLKIN